MNSIISCRNILVLFLVLTASCAKVSQPTGGPRDKLPPVVLKSTPANESTGFNGKRIEIEFDEYVTLDNINEKLLVSPPLERRPRTAIRGKSIIIEYDDVLRDSTTYAFYFLDAIRDLNEGNILDNYKFVFSTGQVIDSLSVTGSVFRSSDLDVPEKANVLLYSNLDDTAVMKTVPDYISRVDPEGFFRIDNIKSGRYRLYALTDDDNSKNYNRVEEPFAFLDSVITVTTENNNIPADTSKAITLEKGGGYRMYLFNAPLKSRYLTNSTRDAQYKLMYSLSLPPDTMEFSFSIPDADASNYMIEKNSAGDTMTVWITDSALYSMNLINTIVKYPYTDSLGNDIYRTDTLPMRFAVPRSKISKSSTRLVLRNNIPGGMIKPGSKVVFTAETPLTDPDTTLTDLFKMVENKKHEIPFSLSRDSLDTRKLVLNAALEEGGQYLFIADSASIRNIYNDVSDSTALRFSVGKAETYSSLTINTANCNTCIIQLLSNTEKVLAEQRPGSSGIVEFRLLDRGTYRVRAIYDLDKDGKWTTGDFSIHRQPEPVSYLPKELAIQQEGWQVKESWDLSAKNVKDPKIRQKPKTTGR